MAERVVCHPTPPPRNGPIDLFRRLLDIELQRLDVAVRIEAERKIVFPETSVIIHDIQRLQAEVLRLEGASRVRVAGAEDELGALLKSMEADQF